MAKYAIIVGGAAIKPTDGRDINHHAGAGERIIKVFNMRFNRKTAPE